MSVIKDHKISFVTRKQRKKNKNPQDEIMVDLMDRFYKTKPLVEVPGISKSKKKKVKDFASFRPKPGHCLDYNISQTNAKLNAGVTQLSLQTTRATYVPVPPEEIPVEAVEVKKKKFKYCNAGPPVWEFVDEKWRRKNEILQRQYALNLKRIISERKRRERKERSLRTDSSFYF